ncbi:hypothetical protein GCM10011506_00790 [Marivirga lumbricoides]|uniref:Uncharacterized protein n=1 Tax=Marivirga lumbricoides TaxID=1046115 RepID=A0ABQ1L7P3_9BACT|nr:hypothetical protein GCM10011506_00790 [Marivirga lumbricoides]
MKKVSTIEEYVNNALESGTVIMSKLKPSIEATVVEVEGAISWNVPLYKYNGILVGFSLDKYHISFGIDCLNRGRQEDTKAKRLQNR